MSNKFPINDFERFGDNAILVLVDHASNHVPNEFNKLGLPDDILETHIAWDIGALRLGEKIAASLQGQLFACRFSRLVIDANRQHGSSDLIPSVSDQIPVPGNQMLSEDDTRYRLDHFHSPYHDQLEQKIVALVQPPTKPFVVSVHSFTKRLMGSANDRPWEIGLLWNEDEASAKTAINWLRKNSQFTIGDNQPYDAHAFNYSIDSHVGSKGLPHLTFEVRQDMLGNDQEITKMSDLLVGSINAAIAKQ